MTSFINKVEVILNELRMGKMVILVDHPEREDEGDLIFPAEIISTDVMNFMIRHCSGIVCLALTSDYVKKLGLRPMIRPEENKSQRGTPFTVSIEAADGITTGVSAADRVKTILTAVSEKFTPNDIVSPGHVFPLHARDGGVLEREGHTEGSIDLVNLAGYKPAAVICELMNADGTMMKGQQLNQFATANDIKIISIEDVIHYRLMNENLIEEETHAEIPLEQYGKFKLTVVKEKFSNAEHIVLTKDIVNKTIPLLTRVHSSCVTGDLFGSQRCDCKAQLHYSLQRISEDGGILIYLSQEGRGIGLFDKIKSYALQENGLDTIEANQKLNLPVDSRKYHIAANILRNNGINEIRLLTNNPHKLDEIKKYGVKLTHEHIPIFNNKYNKKYLLTKKHKLNHFIHDIA
ncbi:MAG: 3,4-dihydroxy-2-butanone-4-phosphate synthase [Gammaproteobacteria bacterium]|nr:3,4-dihydroxy-2-butanone-4-phosphate synthase [Gammaproteobacteria bacterium]